MKRSNKFRSAEVERASKVIRSLGGFSTGIKPAREPISYDPIAGGNVIEVGQILDDVAQKWQKEITKVINDNTHRDHYYIFFHADWYCNYTQMKMIFSPRDKRPPKMLNTGCWEVDNRKGTVTEMWVLPKDAPIPQVGEIAEPVPQLMAEAPNLPLDW